MTKNENILIYNEFNSNLQAIWEKLEILSNVYVFQKYSWCKYWYEIFQQKYEPNIVVVFKNEIPLAIFPLCINNSGYVKKLQFIGGEQADYLSPIFEPDYIMPVGKWNEILKKLKPKYDIVLFYKIPEHIKFKQNYFINTISAKKNGSSFGIILPENISQYENSLKSKFKNDNRRNLRRLKENGEISFKIISTENNNLIDFKNNIAIALEQKSRRLKNHLGNKIFENNLVKDFYENSYLLGDSNFQVEFSTLSVNNELVASHWGFIEHDWFYYLLPTMAGKNWYKYSCGKLLNNYLIEQSISKGHKYFDFTIGDESYKKNWCNNEMKLFSYNTSGSFLGFIFLFYLNLIDSLKKNKSVRSFWHFLKSIIIKHRKKK